MKFYHSIFIAATLATHVQAIELEAITAVAAKFDNPALDEQYKARLELNQLIDQASAPGKEDPAALTKSLVLALQASGTSREADKYILRVMTRVATVDAVDCLANLLNGQDAMLKEEARQVLQSIHDPKAVVALEAALRKTSEKREKIGLAYSLAIQKSPSSVPLLASLVVDSDLEIARAGLSALATIGGNEALDILKKADASQKVALGLKPDVEEALLIAGSGNAGVVQEVYQATKSDFVRLAAFLELARNGADSKVIALIEKAVKSDSGGLRHAALKRGIELNLPNVLTGLEQGMDQMPAEDRLIVLANLQHLKSADVAEKIALRRMNSGVQDERIAALAALGEMPGKPAFDALLQALGDRSPPIYQAAAAALAATRYPAAEAELLGQLRDTSTAVRVLAIKAVVFRQVPGANGILIEIIAGSDPVASKEAMKSLYFTATLDDLRALYSRATATQDAEMRKSITAICSKIATRIDTAEARDLVKPLP